MRFTISREALLKPLQHVVGVVERRQTMPVLSNVLIRSENDGLSFCATDLEIELVVYSDVRAESEGACALPARKLLDICRALPESSMIDVKVSESKGLLSAGRSRFSLVSHPTEGFPVLGDVAGSEHVRVHTKLLKDLFAKTAFAMAQQDVRFYLNGLLLELKPQVMVAVATDGHRLALNHAACENLATRQAIVPRKAVSELMRLMGSDDSEIDLQLGDNHLRVEMPGIRLSTKLIDGRYPDYQRVLPQGADKEIVIDAELFRHALARVSILSNEKFKGVRLTLQPGLLRLQAQNMEHESAEEELEVDYDGEPIETGFNVHYLLDYITASSSDSITVGFKDSRSSILMKGDPSAASVYVVMPMQL
jgi:DNA polymerase III subunit beta